jgi:uncharacterized membrane protein
LIFIGFFIINFIFGWQNKNIGDTIKEIALFQLYLLPLFYVANLIIGIGFNIGYKTLGNMTYVVSFSKLFDLTALLVVSYLLFHETPSFKTLIGVGLVVVGLIVAKW